MPPTSAPEVAPRGPRSAPFEGAIGLALSGGGFRSAAFHLGVLTTAERAGLLHRTRALSAVSGGTLVGARLMLGLAHGESFDSIHHAVRRFLLAADPVAGAMARATRERTTLTRALAEELDGSLFATSLHPTATMRELYDARIPMAEGSFNACELASGRPFRFGFGRGRHAALGHGDASLPRKVAEHVRLADVAAASCAFPGAFEPFVVPDDLTWPDEGVRRQAEEALGGERFELVDGGVHDNQGIEPLLEAAGRLDEDLGMLLVSDAEPEPVDGDTPPGPSGRFRGPRLWQLDALALLFVLMGLVSMGLVVAKAQLEREINDFRWTSDGVAFGVPGLFCGLALLAVFGVRWAAGRALGPLLPPEVRLQRKALRRMGAAQLVRTIHTRARTLAATAGSAFPSRVRRLVDRSAWSGARLADRRVAVQLGSLTAERLAPIDGLAGPTTGLLAAARRAMGRSSALRVGSPEELEDLMRTGQATAVMALVEAFEARLGPVRDGWPAGVRAVDSALRADWDTLNASERALRPAAGAGGL